MVKVGGEVLLFMLFIIFFNFIWFLGQDINRDIVLISAPVAIFVFYFVFLCLTYFIYFNLHIT